MPRTDAATGPPSSSRPNAASRISSSVRARRGPRRPRLTGAVIGEVTILDFSLASVQRLYGVQEMLAHDESWRAMAATDTGTVVARVTGALFVVGAAASPARAAVLSSTFDWPDILREPAGVVLPAVVAGGTGLVWTWFATAWTYAILAVPILLLPAVLGRRDDPVLRAATAIGATSVLLSLIGFLRWVFVVPPLARSYATGDPITQAAVDAAWTAQHQFGGALLGEHLGQLLVIGWSVTLSVIILRSRVLPRWLGATGLVVSALYLLNQGDVLATAVPGFPVWDLAGLLGSTGWGLWVAALGVTVLLRPTQTQSASTAPETHGSDRVDGVSGSPGVDRGRQGSTGVDRGRRGQGARHPLREHT